MNNVVNQVSYLRTSREFSDNVEQLSEQLNKAYLDIANTVNERIIGIFPTNRPAITGANFFITNQKQQTLRQIFIFTSTAAIAHSLTLSRIPYFTSMYGQYTDGTNWYGLIAGSNVAIAGQVSFYVATSNITFVVGGGSPALTKGIIVLEWMSNI